MGLDLDDDFWEDLLALIDERKVIPVIGQGVVTCGEDDQPFYPWLATRLAERLSLPVDSTEQPACLNDVVTKYYLSNRNEPNKPYTRLFRILKDECPAPGPLLRALASIKSFNLILSTTVDPLLEQSINIERYGGQAGARAISIRDEQKDLPVRMGDMNGALVYHLFGKASPQQDYVLWEGDILEYVIELHDHLQRTGTVDKLSRDLKQHGLLLLGLSFSDWLVRLFLRITQQERLSALRVHPAYLADHPAQHVPRELVMFFGAVTSGVHVVPCCPKDFTRELARRWLEKHPPSSGTLPSAPAPPLPQQMPRGAIFISYAREDEESVRRLVAGLQEGGCTIWYDRERLKPGAYWPNELVDEVKDRCSLFVSIVSKITETSPEGYYHRERNWAAERFTGFSQGTSADEFYVPVVIDDSPIPLRGEHRTFQAVQVSRLVGGMPTEDFVTHVRGLQQKRLRQMSS